MVSAGERRIGVLALQGDVGPHQEVLTRLGAVAVPVRSPHELDRIDGLILPGGESTAIGLLLARSGLNVAIPEHFRRRALPLFGTCAGLILLAKTIRETPDQPHLGLLDITVQRNAFGRQRESCEAHVDSPAFGEPPLHVIFIRAPEVIAVGAHVEVLARWRDRIVLVREGPILAGAFHPELTGEDRVHRYFLDRMVIPSP
ncbi:MAG: pyridoxal 5'-phosphate synthase glutaminase subunit PdxT [Nitrospiria bacterium]